ncbi:MAG: DUF5686 and carboxypeptidase regulatory-like domain-containing protein [Bacteroidota bacterium]
MQDKLSFGWLIFLLFFVFDAHAQISGTVYDAKGEALPFVTIYKEGTSKGTVSNLDGGYSLELEQGEHIIVFKFIGFAEHKELVNLKDSIKLDVTLSEESIEVEEVVIAADAEDPAYRVIRKAIEHREEHKSRVEKYSADIYVKGVVKMLRTPKKIFGKEVGTLDGMLDTTGQGIVYLAESQSKVYFHQPDLVKENMYSSIVAEDDGSYNFNRFVGANFDIYEEYYEFGRSMISPIADNALTYYRYKLLDTRFDDKGRLINRIQVIPKSSVRPTLFGEIYIIEDKWNVKELDLGFTGKAIKEPFFDTIRMRQLHLPVEDDNWMVFSQTMDFKLGALGFKIGGGFTYVFSDYNLNPDFDESFFDNEQFRMDESAIKTDSSFWTSVRPVKLTQEERENYIRKDSLKKLWATKEYKDSVDRVNNKFAFGDILFGYSYANSYKKTYISYNSPLSTYQFNPVTGHAIQTGFDIVKLDSLENRRLNINTNIGYGFADKRLRFETSISLRTNRKFWENWSLNFGDTYRQFDERGPVFSMIESWMSLMYKENLGRYFRKQYAGFQFRREVANGIYVRTGLTYSRRSPLSNNTEYSFRQRERTYALNNPLNPAGPEDFFEPNNDLQFRLDIRFRIGQKYASFPKFRERMASKWPDIWLYYRKGLTLADTDYDRLTLRITKNYVNYNLLGFGKFNIEASTFLNRDEVQFMDFHHFLTNTTRVAVRSRYMRGFKMMPHYAYGTTNDYVLGFYEHHLDGYLMDLLPLANKLGWETVIGGSALVRSDASNYYEVSAGIKDIKIGSFSLFRLDYVWSFGDEGLMNRGLVIGLSGLFE